MSIEVLRQDACCRVCGSRYVETVLHLNPTPLEDQFVRQDQLHLPQPVFPLDLALCTSCGYVHLPHVVSPEASYADYVYVSGITVGLRNHYDEYAQAIVRDFGIGAGSLAIDLGSNDGSMLASFGRSGMRVLGVEPAGAIAELANRSGLPTINGFFTAELAATIRRDHGAAQVVSANYMYANIDDILGFTRAVANLLSPDGIFVVQTGYHPEQMKIKMFDYIYHEHFSYFTVEVLQQIFASCGLQLIQATKTTPKGGSVRIVGQLQGGTRAPHPSVAELIAEERSNGLREITTYRRFAADIQDAKEQLLGMIRGLKAAGKRIVGFGASHSTTTLTYHFDLAPFMEYLVDDNELKHGRYSPGHHLPVHPSERLYQDKPDYVLILAWQHLSSIVQRHKAFLDTGGQFIVPLPTLQTIETPHNG